MKKILTALLVLASLLAVLSLTACGGNSSGGGDKVKATIILIDEDEKEYTYDITFTKGATLREALFEAKLIEEDQLSAMFVETIDGHTANVMEDGCTWMPQDTNREQIMGSFDEITVHDGDTIYLQYYVVPDFD